MTGAVRLQHDGAIARVVLSHPGKLNAMSRAMWRELRQVFDQLQADERCRCIVLRGEGQASAPAATSPNTRVPLRRGVAARVPRGRRLGRLQAVLDCDVPVVAAIQGHCMGAGVEIASCCDIRIAAATAQFGAPIARLGFPMAPGRRSWSCAWPASPPRASCCCRPRCSARAR
jgi:enoyl-CoA hydratase